MRVDKSSADNVREKLAAMKKKKEDAAALQGKDALQLFDRKVGSHLHQTICPVTESSILYRSSSASSGNTS